MRQSDRLINLYFNMSWFAGVSRALHYVAESVCSCQLCLWERIYGVVTGIVRTMAGANGCIITEKLAPPLAVPFTSDGQIIMLR